jgi:beta-lactamase class D
MSERGETSFGRADEGDAPTVFVLNMDCKEWPHVADRMTLTQACLSEIGAI